MANRGRAILCMILSLGAFASMARAATSITATFIPSPPVYEQPLTVRLADSLGPHCWPAPTSLTESAGVITLALHFSDSCSPGNVVPFRDYTLGSFPVGNYLFVYQSCSNNPPPLPSTCNTVLQVPFSVAPPVHEPTPALSLWGILVLVGGIWLIVKRARARDGRTARRDRGD